MSVYKLFASGSTTADGVATLDIRQDGVITGIWASMSVDTLNALDDGAGFEVSFAASNGFTTNDTQASIFGMDLEMGLLTSGGSPAAQIGGLTPLDIPVSQGERLYLHRQVGGTVGVNISVWLYVRDGGSQRPPVRRR